MKKTEGVLKSKKPRALLKKFGAFLAIASVGVAAALGFVGCGTTPSPTPTPGPGPNPNPPITITMTFDDFISDHSTDAVKFFEDNIRPSVVENKEGIKAENWHLNDKDGDNKVESASMSFIYSLNETERAVQVANVTFNPVDVQDIVDGKVTSVDTTVAREDVFTFDAKENYLNQDLATALYNAGNVNADTMLFKDANLSSATRSQYGILNITDSNVEVTYVTGDSGDSKEEFINNLSKDNVRISKSETKLDGVSLYSTGYTLEEFKEDEKPGPDNPDPPKPVDVTNAEIISALEENCIDGIVGATTIGGLKQNKDYIVDGSWYLTKDTDGNITKAEYTYTYQKSNTSAYYVITEINFASPLTAQDIKDGDFNATCNNVYKNANYDPTIQAENQELTNAICNKAFPNSSADATRYIIDNGGILENQKEIHSFTVIQIENGNVKEASIRVEKNDDGYVATINNGNYKEITNGNSYELSGEKVTVEENENVQVANARWAVDFGDDELYYL